MDRFRIVLEEKHDSTDGTRTKYLKKKIKVNNCVQRRLKRRDQRHSWVKMVELLLSYFYCTLLIGDDVLFLKSTIYIISILTGLLLL